MQQSMLVLGGVQGKMKTSDRKRRLGENKLSRKEEGVIVEMGARFNSSLFRGWNTVGFYLNSKDRMTVAGWGFD